MYLSCGLTEHSLSEIGRFYGGRNHATVVHARKKIEGLKASGEEFARALEEMARRLER
jgi:chromosomal replication initiator protein